MSQNTKNILLIAAVVTAVTVVALVRQSRIYTVAEQLDSNVQPGTGSLPVLIEFGSHTCVACKKMMPILDEISKEYADKLTVRFVDIQQNPAIGQKYNIRFMPTQIFFDAAGNEIFRHVGFCPKEGIPARFAEQGVDLYPWG